MYRGVFALLMFSLVGCLEPASAPTQPETGPGGQDYFFGGVEETLVGRGANSVQIFVPTTPQPLEAQPIVVFLHGYQAIQSGFYKAWITHLVRRGSIVIYPVWQTLASLPPSFTGSAASGIETALTWLNDQHLHVDRNRVAFVGHSAGGALAVNLAVMSVDGRLSLKPQALLLAAPGRCYRCGDNDHAPSIPMEAFEALPPDVKMVVMDYSQDDEVGHELARGVFDSAVQIPRSARSFLMVRSDKTGFPTLEANHRAAAAPDSRYSPEYVTNSLDYFSTWKIADALMACAFEGQLCDVALGEGEAQKDMGRWSDNAPVSPMLNDWQL